MDSFKILLLVLFTTLVSISQAHKVYVGGRDGWILNPSENYNHWFKRYRFNIDDTIVFRYKKGSDSVLEVNKADYENCNKTNPIKKFEDGGTEFTLTRSGPFYFISGKDDNCEKGQKLTILVISPRPSSPKSSPSLSAESLPTPPKSSPSPSSSPSPAASLPSPPKSPRHRHRPSPSPSPSPAESLPYHSIAPSPEGPAEAPSPSHNSGSFVAPMSFMMYSVTIVVGALFLC